MQTIPRAMDVRLLTTVPELRTYEEWIAHHPDATLWQSPAWRAFQESLGRQTKLYAVLDGGRILASALVIIDRTLGGLSAWDVPRGPLLSAATPSPETPQVHRTALSSLIQRLQSDARRDRCLAITLSPTLPLPSLGIRISPSPRHEQPEATRILDLTLSSEALLAQMHQKGRYNIRVAEKHGVRIEQSEDTEAFARLAHDTAARDDFRAHAGSHYRRFLSALPGSFLFLAYAAQGENPIAGLIGTIWKECGIYYYGASSYAHRPLMAPYLLQWRAMEHCRAHDCVRYDLLGVAPPDAGPDHPWSGITSFKEKFGGTLVTYPPEQRMLLRPVTNALLEMKRRVMG